MRHLLWSRSSMVEHPAYTRHLSKASLDVRMVGGSNPSGTTTMNDTTIEELKALAAQINEPVYTGPYLREDTMTPELRAVISDKEAFKKYLEANPIL